MNPIITSLYLLIGWIIVYFLWKILNLQNKFPWLRIGPIYVYIKSSRFNKFLEGWSKKNRRVLGIILDFAGIIGLILSIFAMYILIQGIINIYSGIPEATVKVLVPGITISFDILLKMLPAIIIILVSHELAHKVGLHVENIKIKNMGVFLLYLIPGAFVEPDEEVFIKSSPRKRLRILGAGTFINILIGGFFGIFVLFPLLFNALISPLYYPPSGLLINQIIPNSTLLNYPEIDELDVLLYINGIRIKNIEDLKYIKLLPNQTITITILNHEDSVIKNYTIVTINDPYNSSRGIIGFVPLPYYPPKFEFLSPYLPILLFEILVWIYVLGINIAIFNMLPIYGLDGFGHWIATLELLGLDKRTINIIMGLLFSISLTLLILNIFGSIGL